VISVVIMKITSHRSGTLVRSCTTIGNRPTSQKPARPLSLQTIANCAYADKHARSVGIVEDDAVHTFHRTNA
jgi:hypothetical protein